MTPLEFLKDALPVDVNNRLHYSNTRIDQFWTTLTFAQSLDGKIAGINGQQIILSGKESMFMTHWMRSMHDAILVGINTVINDNPQLNTRHLPSRDEGYPQPLPVILDTTLRIPLDCKLIKNAVTGIGRFPLVLCAQGSESLSLRKAELESLGVTVIPVASKEHGRIPLLATINVLQQHGIRSLMIEGGQTVISSCLSSPNVALIDRIIITVAPVFIGEKGLAVTNDSSGKAKKLQIAVTGALGSDIVASYEVPSGSHNEE
ncbi:2,5-diamino-6-(ribosylamino)-4(3H)-pyrimidinone 5'-phosphate reductase [Serendipita sp. 411]|nr:2,5-diamino-6-(ribosylamino)-4(3H)-pyrimidinone 5'-phosphate reductase [Serendipita sp. 411]